MRRRQANKIAKRHIRAQGDALPKVAWRSLQSDLQDYLDGFGVFVEMRDGRIVSGDSLLADGAEEDAVSLVLTAAGPHVSAWDTEEPAAHLAAKLSELPGLEAIMLVNRDPEAFVGYYVRVRPHYRDVH
jgi:hypothetical protein